MEQGEDVVLVRGKTDQTLFGLELLQFGEILVDKFCFIA